MHVCLCVCSRFGPAMPSALCGLNDDYNTHIAFGTAYTLDMPIVVGIFSNEYPIFTDMYLLGFKSKKLKHRIDNQNVRRSLEASSTEPLTTH